MWIVSNNVKAETATGCAKHGNVKAEVAARKTEVVTSQTEVATSCAKHGNVKTEVPTGCAKHGNVKAEVAARKAEVPTGNINNDRLF
ncbi:MAG: hypothetical protein KME30_01870 [Iphinoe sp. HA4291-MV1]|nr:hypothetical protein [Iphinoe sp. HA4291-MV1]